MEKIVINSILTNPAFVSEFIEGIHVQFFEDANSQIISAILKLQSQGRPVTLETLALELGRDFLESKHFKDILRSEIVPNYLSLKNDFKHYLLLKKQDEIANSLLKASRAGNVFDMDFLSKFIDIKTTRPGKYFNEWEEYYASLPPLEKLETGIPFLDKALGGGIELGQLVLISGDPEAGKTLLSVQALLHMSQKHRATYFGFEFGVRKHVETIKSKGFKFNRFNYFIDDQSNDMTDLVSQIKNLHNEGHKVFLVDSQMKLQAPTKDRTIEEVETSKFTILGDLAKSLGVVIMLIIQNSKSDSFTPSGSRKGAHEAHIMVRVTKLTKNEMQGVKSPFERVNYRRIAILKNKQTGLQGTAFFKNENYHFIECYNNALEGYGEHVDSLNTHIIKV